MFLHPSVILFTGQGESSTPWADTPPLRSVHAGTRSTSGRYASYWNANLFGNMLSWHIFKQFSNVCMAFAQQSSPNFEVSTECLLHVSSVLYLYDRWYFDKIGLCLSFISIVWYQILFYLLYDVMSTVLIFSKQIYSYGMWNRFLIHTPLFLLNIERTQMTVKEAINIQYHVGFNMGFTFKISHIINSQSKHVL